MSIDLFGRSQVGVFGASVFYCTSLDCWDSLLFLSSNSLAFLSTFSPGPSVVLGVFFDFSDGAESFVIWRAL